LGIIPAIIQHTGSDLKKGAHEAGRCAWWTVSPWKSLHLYSCNHHLGKVFFFSTIPSHSWSFLMIFTANLRVSILACVTGGLHTVLLNSLCKSLVRSLEQIQYIPPYRQFMAVHSVNYILYYITLH
jgi:hypothetical protein